MKNNQKLILLVIGIISLILITVGVSLAFFNYVKNGSVEHSISSGNVTFKYRENSRGLSLTDAMPMTDEEGKGQSNYFEFKIESKTGKENTIPYNITVRKSENSDDIDEIINLYLTEIDNNVEKQVDGIKKFNLLPDYVNDGENTSNSTEKLLYSSTVLSNRENYVKNYRLRMWIDYDADYIANDYNNKTFSVRVNVYSSGHVYTDEELANANNANISEMKVGTTDFTEVSDTSLGYQYKIELPVKTTLAALNLVTESSDSTVEVIDENEEIVDPTNLSLVPGDNVFTVKVRSINNVVTTRKINVFVKNPVYLNIATAGGTYTDDFGNRRYYGANPNNYVNIGGELWRIIGNFTDKKNGATASGYKLVRNASVKKDKWDTSEKNNWMRPATMKTYLNSTWYPTSKIKGYAKENIVWNLGGIAANTYNSITPNSAYNSERGNSTNSGNAAPKTGSFTVGLAYVSDYGLAAGSRCKTTKIVNFTGSGTNLCKNTDWLYRTTTTDTSGESNWMMVPDTTSGSKVWQCGSYGKCGADNYATAEVRNYPVFFLKDTYKIDTLDGTRNGSSSKPYVLTLDE